MLALALALIAVIELARALPLLRSFARLAAAASRVSRVLRRRASEHWRERAMRLLSAHLLARSVAAGLLLALALVPLALALLADHLLHLGVVEALTHWRPRLLVAGCTIGYALLRHALTRHIARRRLLPG